VRIDGKLDIISDNKDYPTYVANRHEVELIGRVVGRFGSVE
jgi:phage repressor protein C with HTH and peptisase S24 domain